MRRQSLPPPKLWAYDSSTITRPTEDLNVAKPSCLPGSNIKSRIADAAITRTDVLSCLHGLVSVLLTTGLLKDSRQLLQCRLSSQAMACTGLFGTMRTLTKIATAAASQLPVRSEAISASRANTKLVEWSWIRGLPKDRAKTVERPAPEIVVLVNESHEQHPHLDCAVEDDNDLIITPPNSERPSANSTRPTPRPGSERASSSVSYTSTDDSEAGQNQKDSHGTRPRGH